MKPVPSPGRILCVDDQALILQGLKGGLSLDGFEVVTASDGMEAIRLFHQYGGLFGAVLTDHDMPNMNGIELCWSLRTEKFEGIIIVMSGHLTERDFQAYQDLKINGFFAKPFAIDLLVTCCPTN